MFGSASVAEEVCHINRWDQCSLPINALETALELRQLDTLAFFLRSRDSGKHSTFLTQWTRGFIVCGTQEASIDSNFRGSALCIGMKCLECKLGCVILFVVLLGQKGY